MNTELNPRLLDVAETRIDLPELGIRAGTRGTIVEILGESREAFLLEITDQHGVAKEFVALAAKQIRGGWKIQEAAAFEPVLNEAGLAFEEGFLYLQNGLVEEAKRQFAKAFKMDPQLAGHLVNSANGLAQKSAFDSAIAVYELVLELQPQRETAKENLAITHLNRGVEYARRGAIDKALEDFNIALVVGPSRATVTLVQKNLVAAYTQLGIRHAEVKQYREALEKFVLALEIDPSDIPRKNLGLAFVSYFASKLGNRAFARRERIFKQAMRMGLSFSECLNAYGATLASLGEMSEARGVLKEAVKADPTNELAKKNFELVLAKEPTPGIPAFALGLEALDVERASVS